jgi:hypothetical protein
MGIQDVEKRSERWQNKARKGEKTEFTGVHRFANPHFELLSNAVMPSAVVLQHPPSDSATLP